MQKKSLNLIFNLLKIKKIDFINNRLIVEIFTGIKVYRFWISKKNHIDILKTLDFLFFDKITYIYVENFSLELFNSLLQNLSNICFIEVLVKKKKIYFIHMYYNNRFFYFYNTSLILPFSQEKYNIYALIFEEQSLLLNFHQKLNVNKLKLTKYSTATSLYLRLFSIRVHYFTSLKLKLQYANYVRQSFLGGRIFLKDTFNFQNYIYDINFQYGWNMRKKYPVYPLKEITNCFDISTQLGFLKVKIIHLPNRYVSLFPNYKINHVFILYSGELKFLIDLGLKFKIISGVLFKEKKIFNSYYNMILDNWNISSRLDKNLKKNALVSLYGRLGMNVEKSQKITYPYIHLSAAISSEARIQTLKYLISYRRFWYYSDTDSLFLTKPINFKYISTKIGLLKSILSKSFSIKLSLFIRARFYMICLKNKISLKHFFILKCSGIEKYKIKPISFFQVIFNKIITIRISYLNNISFLLVLKIKPRKVINYNSLKTLKLISH